MTPSRWETVRRLFDEAVEQDQPVRADFLADRCGPDLSIRREVETLLAAHPNARDGRFLRDAVRDAVRDMAHRSRRGGRR